LSWPPVYTFFFSLLSASRYLGSVVLASPSGSLSCNEGTIIHLISSHCVDSLSLSLSSSPLLFFFTILLLTTTSTTTSTRFDSTFSHHNHPSLNRVKTKTEIKPRRAWVHSITLTCSTHHGASALFKFPVASHHLNHRLDGSRVPRRSSSSSKVSTQVYSSPCHLITLLLLLSLWFMVIIVLVLVLVRRPRSCCLPLRVPSARSRTLTVTRHSTSCPYFIFIFCL
jgi:hypothetical protein